MYKMKKKRYKEYKGHTPVYNVNKKLQKQQMATRRPQCRKLKPS
jgi:hypothetical protein